jgi:hypothetical protein
MVSILDLKKNRKTERQKDKMTNRQKDKKTKRQKGKKTERQKGRMGLRPYSQYEILVQAFNQYGKGPMAKAKAYTLSDGECIV